MNGTKNKGLRGSLRCSGIVVDSLRLTVGFDALCSAPTAGRGWANFF
jgi:hypothetical protein